MRTRTFRTTMFIILALLLSINFCWGIDISGSVFSGVAKSSNSGRTWKSVLRITSQNLSSGRLEGEIEWPGLNSINKIVGKLNGSNLSFKETEYIKKGGAVLGGEYTATLNNGIITGTWTDQKTDQGTFELIKQNGINSGGEQISEIAGQVYSGNAISSKSKKSWQAVLRIKSHDLSSGKFEGEIEWASLNSINKIVGKLTGANITFKETDYIKRGGAVLNSEYNATLKNGIISGTWTDRTTDQGSFELKLNIK